MPDQMLSCFFPTTIVFIDDNSKYLDSLLSSVNMQHIIPKLFSDPVEAMQFVNQQSSLLWRSFLEPLEEQPADHVGFDINIRDFHQKILHDSQSRFSELTVVVCDYAMPQQNGLETLSAIKDKELKTIMLTGEADELLAVEAFNRGLIDHFIRKSSADFTHYLNRTILSLQQDYITRVTGLMVENIIQGKMPSHCALADPVFIELFNSIKQKHQIVEYYLLDENGSYLLLDTKGKPYFLAVMDNAALESYMQFAIDEKAPDAVIKALKSKTAIPFFYSDDDFNTPPSEWASFLHPAQMLSGKNTYYYGIIPPAQIHYPILKATQTYQYFLEHAQD